MVVIRFSNRCFNGIGGLRTQIKASHELIGNFKGYSPELDYMFKQLLLS